MVAIARPAPLTQQPTVPSSLMNVRPASRAATSSGASAVGSRSAAMSGRRAIHDDADVTLTGDLSGGGDQHLVDREALDRHAEDRFCMCFRFGRGLRELHTTGLAPASGVDLCLHDHLPAQSVGAGTGL